QAYQVRHDDFGTFYEFINNETQKSSFFTLRREGLVCLFLVIAILGVYWQVGNHEFVNYDDNNYITENQHVQAGLTLKSIAWAFTSTHAGNRHPLTWLSHMLDCQIYGLNPGGHHFTNVFFHILNSILLFLVFKKMTGAFWKSAFVAALFALHPLHVESVAWASERKDVLSTFFWMLTMGAYIFYVENPDIKKYLLTVLLFALGLMAKPMLITLPFVLLLLDYWPLGRFQVKNSDTDQHKEENPQKDTKSKKRKSRKHLTENTVQAKEATISDYQWSLAYALVREKIPLFVLAAASGIVTFFAQQGVMSSSEAFPITVRIFNAFVSYVGYIIKMAWPVHLAIFYPHPGMPPGWQIVAACLLLALISFTAVKTLRRYPYFAVGWLWYIGTLVPVIGLVQVGLQSMADRYTYIPLTGIFIIIAWGIPAIAAGWRYKKESLAAVSVILLFILMATTWFQVGCWRNSVTLFSHAIDVTENNSIAHNNLGTAFADQDKASETVKHYTEALRIDPMYADAHYNMGNAFIRQGKISEAIKHYTEALRIKPDFTEAQGNLKKALVFLNEIDGVINKLQKLLEVSPENPELHYDLGTLYYKKGDFDKAIFQ
ncbi:MAG: tetratricopeptide repeat protein, partial [Desulfobacterales bacterium]|nr:tetratricopeptide repeat protein [Desulfobacterales bacterium]